MGKLIDMAEARKRLRRRCECRACGGDAFDVNPAHVETTEILAAEIAKQRAADAIGAPCDCVGCRILSSHGREESDAFIFEPPKSASDFDEDAEAEECQRIAEELLGLREPDDPEGAA